VDLKMVFELLGELDELQIQGRDHPDQGQGGRSVGVGNDGRGLELGGA
jgi:hypothetical protein